MKYLVLGLITWLFLFENLSFSQCATVPAELTCGSNCNYSFNNPDASTFDVNGFNNNSSTSVWCFTGTGSLPSGINNFNNKTIIICGNITANFTNVGSGSIYITSTGTLNFSGNTYLGSTVVNYGTVNAPNLTLNNTGHFYNATPSSALLVTGYLELNGSNQLINNGYFSANILSVVNGTSLCLGAASSGSVGTLNSNGNGMISAASGNACIQITNSFNQTNGNTSTYSDLILCVSSGVSVPSNTGSTTIITDCSSCSAPLPIEMLTFNALLVNRITELSWTTATESNSSHFDVERSADGYSFVKIGEVAAAGNSSQELNYKFFDENPLEGVSYYRIKLVDIDNYTKNSEIRTIYNKPLELINVYPNPVVETVNISIGANKNSDVDVFVFNTLGQLIIRKSAFIQSGTTTLNLDISQLSQAVYLFKVVTEEGDQVESVFLRK